MGATCRMCRMPTMGSAVCPACGLPQNVEVSDRPIGSGDLVGIVLLVAAWAAIVVTIVTRS